MKKNSVIHRSQIEYFLFIICLYIFVFQLAVQSHIKIFQYWDEFYSSLFFLFVVIKGAKRFTIKVEDAKIVILGFVILVMGLISNVLFGYQKFSAVFADIFLNFKFLLSICVSFFLFHNLDFEYFRGKILRHVKVLTFFLFAVLVINKIHRFMPGADKRFGMISESLFYSHPTELASVSFLLLLLLVLFKSNKKQDLLFCFMAVILTCASLRTKAIATICIFILLYYLIIVKDKKISFRYLIFLIPLVIIIGWEQISFYFFSSQSMEMARGALQVTSAKIAKDFFPFGTGFGTFGSYYSGVSYSPVYALYGISSVWGLLEANPMYICDTYWPMILAQTGIIGLICMVMLVVLLLKKIQKLYRYDKLIYLAGISAIGYLLISSTSESAFTNPLAMPLAMVIGIVFIIQDQKIKL